MSDYRPIACGAYDEIEVMAMRRAPVRLQVVDDEGVKSEMQGLVVDTSIHDGAEFLVLESSGNLFQLRLDRIAVIHQADTGGVWRQKNNGVV